MSGRTANPARALAMLPSDEWHLVPMHWHAFTSRPLTPDRSPDASLHDPYAVASWIAERSEANLWQEHFHIASHAGTRSGTTTCGRTP